MPSGISEFVEPSGLHNAPPLLPTGPYNSFLGVFDPLEENDSGGNSSPGHYSNHSYDLSSDGADDLADQIGVGGNGDAVSLASHSTAMSENTKHAFGVGDVGGVGIGVGDVGGVGGQYDHQPTVLANTNPFAQYTSSNHAAGDGNGGGATSETHNELAEVCIEFGADSLDRSKKPKKKASKRQSKKKGGNVSIKIKREEGIPPSPPAGMSQYNTSQYDTIAPVPLTLAIGSSSSTSNATSSSSSSSVAHSTSAAAGANSTGVHGLSAANGSDFTAQASGRSKTSNGSKKRKTSSTLRKQEAAAGHSGSSVGHSAVLDGGGAPAGSSKQGGGGADPQTQLQWIPHFHDQWHNILDEYGRPSGNFQFNVRVDKGFTYSAIDDSFVCQRKNHFQMTVTMDMLDQPRFAQLAPGRMLQPIREVFLCVHGVKSENGSSAIPIEQAQVDRSKCVLQPVRVQLTEGTHSKVTLARLHFSETTANNMRKKGKPNPEQRYFNLVISLVANLEGTNVTLSSVKSRDIIVRASNLGHFAESEPDGHWVKAQGTRSIVHTGNVGINTKAPQEALSVHGNVQVTGSVLQPSDGRLKNNFRPLDSKLQLDNVKRLTLYDYDLKDSWTAVSGRAGERITETGVIAQQVQGILPSAVRPTNTNVTLANGQVVNNLLMVNKERIFMENVGAVQELCRMTENLENRIKEIEALNDAVTGLSKESDSESEAEAWLARGYSNYNKHGRRVGTGGDGRRGAQLQQFPVMRMLVYCGLVMFLFAAVAVGIVYAAKEGAPLPPANLESLLTTVWPDAHDADPQFVVERPCLTLSTDGRCGSLHGHTACRDSEYQNWHCSDSGWCSSEVIENGHANSEYDFNRACM